MVFVFGTTHDAAPRVARMSSAARAGFAGDFRGWLRPSPIEIWSSKTQKSFRLGLRPSGSP